MASDYYDELDSACPKCGGDGVVEYLECPELWGEDCPSLVNHLLPCPLCAERAREEMEGSDG